MLIVEMATDAPQNKSASDELNMDTDWQWVNRSICYLMNIVRGMQRLLSNVMHKNQLRGVFRPSTWLVLARKWICKPVHSPESIDGTMILYVYPVNLDQFHPFIRTWYTCSICLWCWIKKWVNLDYLYMLHSHVLKARCSVHSTSLVQITTFRLISDKTVSKPKMTLFTEAHMRHPALMSKQYGWHDPLFHRHYSSKALIYGSVEGPSEVFKTVSVSPN